jgi:hypothetical protein
VPVQQDSRGKWAVFAAILAVLVVGILLVAVLGGGSSDEEYALKVERMPGAPGTEELVVSVPDAVNAARVARDKPTVGLVCFDGRHRVVLRKRHPWPFVDEPGYALPHIHEPASPQVLRVIASCKLTGTTIPLEGELGLRG